MTPRSNDDTHPADAIAMLKADHQRIRELVAHYEATTNPETQWTIAEDVLGELDVHAQLEEQIFYPAVVDQSDEGERLAQGSLEEALIGFQGRGRDEVVQSDFYHDLFLKALPFQWPYK